MGNFRTGLTVLLVLILAASIAACGAQEQAEEARQLVGEALVGEPTPPPGVTKEDIDTIFQAADQSQEISTFLPLEVCGNNVDDDLNGFIDADDIGCQVPDGEPAPLPEDTARRMTFLSEAADAPASAQDCKVTVAVLSAEILEDNESGDDEFFLDVASSVGARKRLPATGEYLVPSGSTLPYTIPINTTIGTRKIGHKGEGVPVKILVVTSEADSVFNDAALAETILVANCPNTMVAELRTWSFSDDIDAKILFGIWWDP